MCTNKIIYFFYNECKYGEYINNIRYADDTIVFANNMSSLQKIVDKIVDISESFGSSLNINKNKYMVILKK